MRIAVAGQIQSLSAWSFRDAMIEPKVDPTPNCFVPVSLSGLSINNGGWIFSLFFFLCGVEVWTQDLIHATQMFYHWTTSSVLKGKFPKSFRQLAFKRHCHYLEREMRETKSELNGENDSGSWKGDGLLSSVPAKCRVLQGEGFPPPWVRRETDSACTLCKVSHQALGGNTKVIHDYWLQVSI